jgi:hypothetical protein
MRQCLQLLLQTLHLPDARPVTSRLKRIHKETTFRRDRKSSPPIDKQLFTIGENNLERSKWLSLLEIADTHNVHQRLLASQFDAATS